MKVCRHNVNGWCNVRAIMLRSSRISPCGKCPLGMELTVIDNRKETEMKVNEIKQKVASKVAKSKAKVAKKCGKCTTVKTAVVLFSIFAIFVNSGCTAPAQRAQTAETTQKFYIYEGATANFTFGSEFVSLAQSNETGGNDAGQVTTQTTDTKPEIAVGVGGSSAGVGSSGAAKQGVGAAIGAAADAIGGLFGGSSDGADATQTADCADGNCSEGACSDGNCAPCSDGNCTP